MFVTTPELTETLPRSPHPGLARAQQALPVPSSSFVQPRTRQVFVEHPQQIKHCLWCEDSSASKMERCLLSQVPTREQEQDCMMGFREGNDSCFGKY